ncbi:MAG: LuxR C-terminal-related transcriptional regulator [Hyphomonadaceae bacterium]|nr:LuxR C-terminal-related transcriptional regulator [Hyphomonadaceae bacterium]
MGGDEPVDMPAENRAESALELLKSLARADEDPDRFTQACLDWSRLSQDATAIPEFQSVLSMISTSGRETLDPISEQSDFASPSASLFTLDINGIVTSIPRDLSEFLSLKVGDTLEPLSFENDEGPSVQIGHVVELSDRFGLNRHIKIWPQLDDGLVTGYTARVVLSSISQRLREQLKSEYDLTTSEIEILQLVFLRLNLEQVADMRGIKLSTVRTHISRITSKLSCRSLVEAVSTTLELSRALINEPPPLDLTPEVSESQVRHLTLPTPGRSVEYRRYGPTGGQPVIVLHSLEYGYIPSPQMIRSASSRGLNLIFPVRPGFGATSRVESSQDAARMMLEFVRALELSSVTLVGLSTAAPIALLMSADRQRIGKTALVNYGLNVADKLSNIQPSWIRGMLRMSLNSPSSFTVGLRALTTIIRTFGGLRFYRRLYANQASDQAYLEKNQSSFELTSNYLVRAYSQSIRHDIVAAFLNNRDLESSFRDDREILVTNSSDQHGVAADAARDDAARLGVRFDEAPYPGRNWLFQNPDYFFDLIESM